MGNRAGSHYVSRSLISAKVGNGRICYDSWFLYVATRPCQSRPWGQLVEEPERVIRHTNLLCLPGSGSAGLLAPFLATAKCHVAGGQLLLLRMVGLALSQPDHDLDRSRLPLRQIYRAV